MQQKQQNGFLFGLLLSVSFLIVLAVWLPNVKNSFVGIGADLSNGTKGMSKGFESQWRDAQNAIQDILPESPLLAGTKSANSPEVSQDVVDTLKQAISSGVATSSEAVQVSQNKAVSTEKSFCTRQGGVYQTRTASAASMSYGVCVFSNGSECSASMFEYNKCHIGQFTKAEDGIPRKADLVISVDKTTVRVVNQGWATSVATVITDDTRRISVPAIKSGSSFTVMGLASNVDLTVDPDNTIQEIIEENNSYHISQ